MLAMHGVVCLLLYGAIQKLVAWQPASQMGVADSAPGPSVARPIAFTSALWFAIHPINFYTTYDHAYFAEPLLTCCLIVCVWAFVARRYWIALLCLTTGLLAKEAAVVAPFILTLLLLVNPELRVARKQYLPVLVTMFVMVAAYLAVYARAVSFRGATMASAGHAVYVYHFNTTILANMARYARWAFTLPSGWVTDNWIRSPVVLSFACVLAALVSVATITDLVRGRRLLISAGLIWFLVTALPTAGLDKFLLHHAYVPLLGISVLLAASFRLLGQWVRPKALLLCLAVLSLAFLLNSLQIVKNEERASWVAHSSRFVLGGVSVFRQWDHTIDERSTIWAVDSRDDPAEVIRGTGALARFATRRNVTNIRVLASADLIPRPIARNDVAVRITEGGVEDLTPVLRAGPGPR